VATVSPGPGGPVGGAAIRLLKALLTDLLMVEKSDPMDFVNAELDVMSVTRTVSTPSMLAPLPRMFVSLVVGGPTPPIARLLVTV